MRAPVYLIHAVTLCCMTLLASPQAKAQPDANDERVKAQPDPNGETVKARAGQLWRTGKAALERGDHYAAGEAFDQAYVLSPHAQSALAAGLAWEQANEPARAANAYANALVAPGLDPRDEATASANLEQLRTTLSVVKVTTAKASVTVGPVTRLEQGAERFIKPGHYSATLHCRDGRTAIRALHLKPQQTEIIHAVNECIPKPAAVTIPPEPTATSAPAPSATGSASSLAMNGPANESLLTGVAVAGFISGGLALAAGGTAVGLGVAANNAADEWNASRIDLTLRDSAESLELGTNVALVAAAALAATSAGLFIAVALDDSGDASAGSPPAARMSLAIRPTRFDLQLRF